MIKYFVRTTGERKLDKTYSQIEYELLIDKNGNSGKAFLSQLSIIDKYDCVVLEDDLILCRDFKEKIEKVINEHKNEIINFFTSPMRYFKSKQSKYFTYNQCTYFPKGIGNKIYESIKFDNDTHNSQEKIMHRALVKMNLKHFQYRPCLVQHIDNNSLMGNNVYFSRRSPYFEDYLNDLHINYESAFFYKQQLLNYMEKYFKTLK